MKDLRDAIQDIRQARENMEKLNDRLPDMIAIEALNVIDENFERESYNSGNGITRWPARSPKTNKAYDRRSGGLKGSVFNSGNKILQQTGNLRAAVRKTRKGNKVFIGVNLLKITYAQIHNEGGTIQVKERRVTVRIGAGGRFVGRNSSARYVRNRTAAAHTIKMPRRQYMPLKGQGPNPLMLQRAKRKIDFEQDRVMSKFKR